VKLVAELSMPSAADVTDWSSSSTPSLVLAMRLSG